MNTEQEGRVTSWRRTYTTLAWLGAGTLVAVAAAIILDSLFKTFSDGFGGLGQGIIFTLIISTIILFGGVVSTLGSLDMARKSLKTATIVAAVAAALLLLTSIF